MSIKPQAHAIHMKKEIPITVVIVKGKWQVGVSFFSIFFALLLPICINYH